MLEKTYKPEGLETRHYDNWEKAGAFKAGAGLSESDKKNAESFSIVLPPPNVTGSLHMGHALNNVVQDILIRYNRMRGKNTLWQPGMDHAGIATQMVVERQLAEKKLPGRVALGREKFVEKIWEWKEESGGIIQNQQRRLGSSCDWSRSRFTMDEGLSEAVLKTFVELHKQGYIYRAKRLVNWDPKLQTAISDIEVEQIEKDGKLWHFKYPIKGMEGQYITVATTRPETMFGDTGIAVHPDDERYKDLVGKTVILPLVGREIPIVADDYADPEQGSGAVKITPAHDFNDFEVGKRAGLEVINILDANAHLNENVPEEFVGLERFKARKIVVEKFEQLGLLVKIDDNPHTVPYGDRSGVVIEPWLSDQWYVDAKKLAIPAMEAVRNGSTKFVPQNWEKTYFEWMENIEPWCISRQLWWGHQIPVWYGPDNEIFVGLDEAEAQKLADKHYGKIVELRRDSDVLDTWFSSALWPFATMGWPEKTTELEQYYKTSVLVTAFDIIFFWVARMMMFGTHFMQEEPFETVYIHAIVRDEFGAKMSKSKGNVMDPLDLIDQYGADAVRFTLSSMAGQGRDIKLSNKVVENNRNFVTKLWNACRFAEMHDCKPVEGFDPKNVKLTLSKWLLSELSETTNAIEDSIAQFKFNDASSAIYKFTWNIFCDWYIELTKPILFGENEADKTEIRMVTAYVIDHLLHLMHPFMPFVTEELWNRFDAEDVIRESMLITSPWPSNSVIKNDNAKQEINWVINFITEIRSVRAEMNIPAGAQTPVIVVNSNTEVQAKITTHNNLLKKMARLENITIADKVPDGAIQILIDGVIIALPLAGVIDIQSELDRLTKEMGKAEKDVLGTEKRLSNESFVSKAPEKIINEQKERLQAAKKQLVSLQDAFTRFEKLKDK
ncbi:MAG: valine--tRNA ligase [Rhizobiales bacterium]|nr:valine--tRNA ligase [Hyphomicrobiales bacterium]